MILYTLVCIIPKLDARIIRHIVETQEDLDGYSWEGGYKIILKQVDCTNNTNKCTIEVEGNYSND